MITAEPAYVALFIRELGSTRVKLKALVSSANKIGGLTESFSNRA